MEVKLVDKSGQKCLCGASSEMFDVPPKCPALADKLTGLFNWRHTYRVHEKHKGLSHGILQKSYSLNLPRNVVSSSTANNSFISAKTVPSTTSEKALVRRRCYNDKFELIDL